MTNTLAPNMISSLKKELPKAKSDACGEYDFASIPNSELYKTRLDGKKKRRDSPEDYIGDWKRGTSERVCRNWIFWKK